MNHLNPSAAAITIMKEQEIRKQSKTRAANPPSSSLAWLMPPSKEQQQQQQQQQNNNPHKTLTPKAQPIPGANPGESLTPYLLRLSRLSLDLINTRLYERHPLFLSPDFFSEDYMACMAESNDVWFNLQECLSHWKSVTNRFPEFHIKVLEGTANLDEAAGRGEVFQNLEITGQPVGVVRQGMVVLEWRREGDGRWRCCRVSDFRGVIGIGDGG